MLSAKWGLSRPGLNELKKHIYNLLDASQSMAQMLQPFEMVKP